MLDKGQTLEVSAESLTDAVERVEAKTDKLKLRLIELLWFTLHIASVISYNSFVCSRSSLNKPFFFL